MKKKKKTADSPQNHNKPLNTKEQRGYQPATHSSIGPDILNLININILLLQGTKEVTSTCLLHVALPGCTENT